MTREKQSRPGRGGSETPDEGGLSFATLAQTTSQLDAALALAAAGMYVFPVDHPELAQIVHD